MGDVLGLLKIYTDGINGSTTQRKRLIGSLASPWKQVVERDFQSPSLGYVIRYRRAKAPSLP